MTRCWCILALCAVSSLLRAQPPKLPHSEPEAAGMDADRLGLIDSLVKEAIADAKMPGCVVTIGRRGSIVFQRAYGHRQLQPEREPMTVDTVFDLASLTKPIATATSIMVLLEQGKVRVRSAAADFLPKFASHGKDEIRVRHLLTHQSGLPPFLPIERTTDNAEAGWQAMFDCELRTEPGSSFVYSDINFLMLGKMVESVSGRTLHEFSHQHIFEPLGMTETGFLPPDQPTVGARLRKRAATTEQREGHWMRGEVHDPRAYFLGGVAGHAGLFSTADDLAIYAQMMLGGGGYYGVRILSPPTVELMTAAYDVGRGTRGLGWDKQSPYSSNRGELMSERAFGHGGFTGTGIWIDPQFDLFVIFLSNRVHPDGKGNVNDLIGRIGNVAVAAIVPQPPSPSNAPSPCR